MQTLIVRLVTAATVSISSASLANAQEGDAAAKKKSPERRAPTRAFFKESRVDFWGDLEKKPLRTEDGEKTDTDKVTETLWAEPIRMPDGRYSTYVPPKAVLEFLENPTKETGAKYLAWQEERMAKLKAAMELLAELKREREGTKADAAKKPELEKIEPRLEAAGRDGMEILYFKKSDCPYCAEQDKVFAALAKSHPGLKVRVVTPTDNPELWKEYGISVVPSMVVPGTGGKKFMLRGYMPPEDLLRVVEEVNRVRK